MNLKLTCRGTVCADSIPTVNWQANRKENGKLSDFMGSTERLGRVI
jgi:hypothetical protein